MQVVDPSTPLMGNGAVLIDLENLRINWQSCYRTIFGYKDLCVFINELESYFTFNCISLQIYATNEDYHSSKLDSRLQMLNRREYSQTRDARFKYALAKDISEYKNLIKKLRKDTRDSQIHNLHSFETRQAVHPPYSSLYGPRERVCRVELNEFDMKNSGGRTVQRGADCSLSGDLVHATYSSSIDSVYVVSGDSDFVNVMEDCASKASSRGVKFYMLSHMMAFASYRNIKSSFMDNPELKQYYCNGVTYISIERTFQKLVTYNSGKVSLWPKRTPIPMNYYENDSSVHSSWSKCFKAAEKRFEYLILKRKIREMPPVFGRTSEKRTRYNLSYRLPIVEINMSDEDIDPNHSNVASKQSDSTELEDHPSNSLPSSKPSTKSAQAHINGVSSASIIDLDSLDSPGCDSNQDNLIIIDA